MGSNPTVGTSINTNMIYIPKSLDDPLFAFIKDDPVRPEIPLEFRLGMRSEVMFLVDTESKEPLAVLCIAFSDGVPTSLEELFVSPVNPDTAIFYTIWSYKPGAGTELVMNAVSAIQEQFENIKRFVTLSPKSEMAKKFHLKNGASIFRENEDTVNYEYLI